MITFLGFNQETPGGGQRLVVNFTKGLFHKGERAKIYCSKNSIVYKELTEDRIGFIHIDSDEIKPKEISNYIFKEDVVILMYFSVRLINGLRKSNPKIIFYSIFPEVFFSYKKLAFIPLKRNLINLIKLLNEKNALCFMDFSNYKTINNYGKLNFGRINYIPVPITYDLKIFNLRKRALSSPLTVTYIGRGDEKWKIYPVIKIYQDLIKLKVKVNFNIITTESQQFQQMLDLNSQKDSLVSISYILNIRGKALSEYLVQNSDLHFSMGTSALEAAVYGVPTILVDFSNSLFPDHYLYRWIFENNENFNLGFLIEPFQVFSGMEMLEVVNSVLDISQNKLVSERCQRYAIQNHSLISSVEHLQYVENQTNCHVFDLLENSKYLMMKNWLLRMKYILE
jgi:hypothetical protein